MGLVELVNRVVPRTVVSGIQLGLGIRMVALALTFMGAEPWRAVDGPVAGGAFFLVAIACVKIKRRTARVGERRRVAAPRRLPRGYFRGDGSRRRRGCRADRGSYLGGQDRIDAAATRRGSSAGHVVAV